MVSIDDFVWTEVKLPNIILKWGFADESADVRKYLFRTLKMSRPCPKTRMASRHAAMYTVVLVWLWGHLAWVSAGVFWVHLFISFEDSNNNRYSLQVQTEAALSHSTGLDTQAVIAGDCGANQGRYGSKVDRIVDTQATSILQVRVNVAMPNPEESKKWVCEVCGLRSKSYSALLSHNLTHRADRNFKCSLCDSSYRQRVNLLAHIRLKHTRDSKNPIKCHQCLLLFRSNVQMKRHRCKSVDAKVGTCNACNKTFKTLERLEKHKSHHRVCPKCKRIFTKHGYVQHIKYENACRPNLTCHTCGKVLSSARNLNQHLRLQHVGTIYTCIVCNKSFGLEFSMRSVQSIVSGSILLSMAQEEMYTQVNSPKTFKLNITTHVTPVDIYCLIHVRGKAGESLEISRDTMAIPGITPRILKRSTEMILRVYSRVNSANSDPWRLVAWRPDGVKADSGRSKSERGDVRGVRASLESGGGGGGGEIERNRYINSEEIGRDKERMKSPFCKCTAICIAPIVLISLQDIISLFRDVEISEATFVMEYHTISGAKNISSIQNTIKSNPTIPNTHRGKEKLVPVTVVVPKQAIRHTKGPNRTLHVFLQHNFRFMYNPMIETVIDGAYGAGIPFFVYPTPHSALFSLRDLRNLGEAKFLSSRSLNSLFGPKSPFKFMAKMKKGDVFVWVGYRSNFIPWKLFREKGFYTIHYQLEPVAWRPIVCRSFSLREADEVWDYSITNVNATRNKCRTANETKYRHISPGYQYHAYKANLSQKEADILKSKIYFLGTLGQGKRNECWNTIMNNTRQDIQGMLSTKYDIWSMPLFQRFSENSTNSGILLNIHKGCMEPSIQAIEPRISFLLSAGAMVISQPCHPLEQKAYAGLVDFIPLQQFGRRIDALLRMPLAKRQTLANSRRKLFKERFDPYEIIKRAGLLDMFGIGNQTKRLNNGPPPCTAPRVIC
ncbi:hypothetical protein AAMO2058_000555300 [Amorphochlora amoebiformis]